MDPPTFLDVPSSQTPTPALNLSHAALARQRHHWLTAPANPRLSVMAVYAPSRCTSPTGFGGEGEGEAGMKWEGDGEAGMKWERADNEEDQGQVEEECAGQAEGEDEYTSTTKRDTASSSSSSYATVASASTSGSSCATTVEGTPLSQAMDLDLNLSLDTNLECHCECDYSCLDGKDPEPELQDAVPQREDEYTPATHCATRFSVELDQLTLLMSLCSEEEARGIMEAFGDDPGALAGWEEGEDGDETRVNDDAFGDCCGETQEEDGAQVEDEIHAADNEAAPAPAEHKLRRTHRIKKANLKELVRDAALRPGVTIETSTTSTIDADADAAAAAAAAQLARLLARPPPPIPTFSRAGTCTTHPLPVQVHDAPGPIKTKIPRIPPMPTYPPPPPPPTLSLPTLPPPALPVPTPTSTASSAAQGLTRTATQRSQRSVKFAVTQQMITERAERPGKGVYMNAKVKAKASKSSLELKVGSSESSSAGESVYTVPRPATPGPGHSPQAQAHLQCTCPVHGPGPFVQPPTPASLSSAGSTSSGSPVIETSYEDYLKITDSTPSAKPKKGVFKAIKRAVGLGKASKSSTITPATVAASQTPHTPHAYTHTYTTRPVNFNDSASVRSTRSVLRKAPPLPHPTSAWKAPGKVKSSSASMFNMRLRSGSASSTQLPLTPSSSSHPSSPPTANTRPGSIKAPSSIKAFSLRGKKARAPSISPNTTTNTTTPAAADKHLRRRSRSVGGPYDHLAAYELTLPVLESAEHEALLAGAARALGLSESEGLGEAKGLGSDSKPQAKWVYKPQVQPMLEETYEEVMAAGFILERHVQGTGLV